MLKLYKALNQMILCNIHEYQRDPDLMDRTKAKTWVNIGRAVKENKDSTGMAMLLCFSSMRKAGFF